MTNTITILAIAVLAISVPSAFACSEGDIQHWTNIRTSVTDTIFHATEPSFSNEFFLPLPTMGSEILSNDNLRQIVADRLNELGYLIGSTPREITVSDIGFADVSLNAGYSTICKNGVMEMVGGMLIQPDATAMFLAYGIANAIWIAPTMAGLAAGIYLTKSKWKR